MSVARLKFLIISAAFSCFSFTASAGLEDFHTGTVFPEFGKIAAVDTDFKIPKRAKFKILFDAEKGAEPGKINRTLNSAARFINMHAEAGVPVKNMKLAIVVHGKASLDMMRSEAYKARFDGMDNGSAKLIKALTDKGIRVILCGQSAAFHGIDKDDLAPGVEMALSAMTAHALLQQKGYTLNPF